MWTLSTLLKHPVSDEAKCLVWARFAAPSFIADVEFLDRTPETDQAALREKAFIIRNSNLTWGFEKSFGCELPVEQWAPLQEALLRYPDVVQRYLDAEAYKGVGDSAAEEARRGSMSSVKGRAERVRPFAALQDVLYQGERHDAFAMLAARFPEAGGWLYGYVHLAKRLVARYQAASDADMALATLDLMARYTSEETLPRAMLLELYEQADPLRGPARFESISSSSSGDLVSSSKQADLSSVALEARTGEPFKLSDLHGQLVLLDFWSIGCGPCIEEIPDLNALAEAYEGTLVLVSVNSDLRYSSSQQQIQDFIEEYDIAYQVVLDTDEATLMERFGVQGWPARFLIDEQGVFLMEPTEKRTRLSLREVRQYLDRR